MTPHINAKENDFAPVCLVPGDPLRAKYIAENYLTDARLVTNVRGMLGYTGFYKGKKVSAMGVGMGIPSASIYYIELIKYYNVKQFIRIGSCGGISEDINLRDIIIGMGACTDSKVNRTRFAGHDFAPIADFNLLESVIVSSRKMNLPIKVGNLFSSDDFYSPEPEFISTMAKLGILGVEMEASALYRICAEYSIQGIAICTVSDHITKQEALSSYERAESFDSMINMSLETLSLI